MMSHENNADSEFDPANPLGVINHAAVCSEIKATLLSGTNEISEALGSAWSHQLIFDKTTSDALVEIGSFLLPPDIAVEDAENDPKLRAYIGGATIALQTVDATCNSLGIDAAAFRVIWREYGLFRVTDLSADVFKDKTPREKYDSISDGIMLAGQIFLANLDDAYSNLIDELEQEYVELHEGNIFKASYGYTLGHAYQAMARMFQVLETRRIVEESHFDENFDAGVAYLSESPIPVVFISDNEIANQIDTKIYYSETEGDLELYLGEAVEEQLDQNGEVVDTLQALALNLYPNEFTHGALDEQGEAFFYGCILGLEYAEGIGKSVEIDLNAMHRRWRGNNVHNRLYATDFIPVEREKYVDDQVVKTLRKTELSVDTSNLADKICHSLAYEVDEAVAFKKGLQYTLETYKTVINSCINTRISARVKLAMSAFDNEIVALLSD